MNRSHDFQMARPFPVFFSPPRSEAVDEATLKHMSCRAGSASVQAGFNKNKAPFSCRKCWACMLMQFHALYLEQKVLLPCQGHPRSWKYLVCKTFCHHQQPCYMMLLEFSSIQVQYLNHALQTKRKQTQNFSELGQNLQGLFYSE